MNEVFCGKLLKISLEDKVGLILKGVKEKILKLNCDNDDCDKKPG